MGTEELQAADQGEHGPSLRQAVRFWWELGWISFGGTAAHLSIMHQELVERRHWIDSEHFFHALSLCMLLLGPEAQQLAIYIGWRLNGNLGGILAGTLFVLPSLAILLALSLLYGRFGQTAAVIFLFRLLEPIVVALVLRALLRIGRRALRSTGQQAVAGAAFAGITLLHISLPWAMGITVLSGVLYSLVARKRATRSPSLLPQPALTLNKELRRIASVIGIGTLLAAIPVTALRVCGLRIPFWTQLCSFFTRTAFVTLGGSYTVIPYVAQLAVYKLGWLTRPEMLDGFALAETTPEPLIIVVAFVGFMAGFHRYDGSLAMGSLALLLTSFYTFLPCFLLVFAGAPWVVRTKENRFLRSVLQLVTSVVVAALAQLTLFLLRGVIFPEGIRQWREVNVGSLVELVIALAALYFFALHTEARSIRLGGKQEFP